MTRRAELILYALYLPVVMVMTLWGVYRYDAAARWPEGFGWAGIFTFAVLTGLAAFLCWRRYTPPHGILPLSRAAGVSAVSASLGLWLMGLVTAGIEFAQAGDQPVMALLESAVANLVVAIVLAAFPGGLWGLMFIALINRFRRAASAAS